MRLEVTVNLMEYIKMKIKLPKSISQLRDKHLKAIAKVDIERMSISERVELFCNLTGVESSQAKRISFEDVTDIVQYYFDLFNQYKTKELPIEIKVGGKFFTKIKSAETMPTDWHIDMSAMDMTDNCIVAAFYYIEKDMRYCMMDKHDNILNPVKKRADIFREHLPANLLVDIRLKFQNEMVELEEKLYGKDRRKSKGGNSKYAWENIVHALAKEFKMTWNEITSKNIFWFKHKSDYFVHLQSQRNKK